jgi:RND family efflux transporter MFP subunit
MFSIRISSTLRWSLLAAALVAAGWLLAQHQLTTGNTLKMVDSSAPADQSNTMTVAPVTFRPVKRTIEADGTLCACEEVSICASAEGRVAKLQYDVSDHVRPGDQLLQVDPTDYQLAVCEAEKSLLVELAKLGLQAPPSLAFDINGIPTVVEAKVKAENCKSHLDRAKILFAHKAMTEEEMFDKRVEFRMAQAEYENQVSLVKAELATIQVKQEALAIAQQRLADTIVKAPVPETVAPGTRGTAYFVSRRCVTEGSYVHPGVEVYRLLIDKSLKLRVRLPDSRADEVRNGQAVEVSADGLLHPLSASIARIDPVVDPATHTFDVEVQVPNSAGLLKVGSLAKATIFTCVDHDAATVPSDAPLTSDGETKLFLAEGEHYKTIAVTLGAKCAEWVEVLRPALPRNARVVTNGQLALVSGSRR